MEKRTLKPFLILLVLMLLTSLALTIGVDVDMEPESGVKLHFPAQIGEWAGEEILYCQNRECGRAVPVGEVTEPDTCPDCGAELHAMSIDERHILPSDTRMLRKRYRNPLGQELAASIVLSGRERDSIHRPELCLTGQGLTILSSRVIQVPIEGRDPLRVKVLETLRQMRLEDGRNFENHGYYAYWFVGKDRETPSHVQRMIWMSTDRLFHSVSHRWAYIAIAGQRPADGREYQQQIRDFIAELYPSMLTGEQASAAADSAAAAAL